MHYVDALARDMKLLQKTAERVLQKISAEGISGNYSGNSDVHKYAASAWRSSWALMEIRLLEEKLLSELNEKSKTKKPKKQKKEKK